jgi:hypothetical protein
VRGRRCGDNPVLKIANVIGADETRVSEHEESEKDNSVDGIGDAGKLECVLCVFGRDCGGKEDVK